MSTFLPERASAAKLPGVTTPASPPQPPPPIIPPPPTAGLRLNLGCGQNLRQGFVNVDKFGSPDVQHDLEQFPWPWRDSCVSEVALNHVLEHLGHTPDVFLKIVKELHRVCMNGAVIRIAVPHPRSDDFLNDPTHVRVVTPTLWTAFSKRMNRYWGQIGAANSPLGLYLDVDFELGPVSLDLSPKWAALAREQKLTAAQLGDAAAQFNNVVQQIRMEVIVLK